jgi:hypothetical protein
MGITDAKFLKEEDVENLVDSVPKSHLDLLQEVSSSYKKVFLETDHGQIVLRDLKNLCLSHSMRYYENGKGDQCQYVTSFVLKKICTPISDNFAEYVRRQTLEDVFRYIEESILVGKILESNNLILRRKLNDTD